MRRKTLIGLVAADVLFLFAVMFLVSRQLISERAAGLSVFPILMISNLLVIWKFGKREGAVPAEHPPGRLVWFLAWCAVWGYTLSALVYVARLVAEPSRVTAVVAAVGCALAVYFWWIMLRVRRKRQARAAGALTK